MSAKTQSHQAIGLVVSMAIVSPAWSQSPVPEAPADGVVSPEIAAKHKREKRLLWGDTHLHTTYSSDAFANNNLSATPDTAYRYARGIPVVHPFHGARVQIETPLDFLVVSDHAEFMGVVRNTYFNGLGDGDFDWLTRAKAWVSELILRRRVNAGEARRLFVDVLPEPAEDIAAAARDWEPQVGWIPAQPDIEADTWREITQAADRNNQPGEFSALIGWEYSATPGGANLHRIVVSDVDASTAQTFVPFGLDDSTFPEDLWTWLEQTAEATGGNFLAIPHNSNISKGAMFDSVSLKDGRMDAEYAAKRQFWEPVAEITQYKGDSETHPDLSPDDPFADFETYPYYIQKYPTEYKASEGDYVRSALKRGLAIEQSIGINPYQFGVIGSTDSHTALPAAEEGNFHGKMATDSIPANKKGYGGDEASRTFGWAMSASGLAGVWAAENTRASIVEALRRREVYATTGPRIGVRMYGGWDLSQELLTSSAFPGNISDRAVPMGGELKPDKTPTAPTFLLEATADPMSGTLDRIQMIKGWVSRSGKTYERVYDLAWAGEGRVRADGTLEPIASTVDFTTGKHDNSVGEPRLTAAWTDPDFDPEVSAFYYARVLQIPTARHSLLDTLALDDAIETARPDSIQERAYTSAIWYQP